MTQTSLGHLIRERRQALNLTMDGLAERAHISRSSVHRIEHGHQQRATPRNLARVLSVVGIAAGEARANLPDDEYLSDVLRSLAGAGREGGRTRHGHESDLYVIRDGTAVLMRPIGGGRVDAVADVLEAAGWLVTEPVARTRASGAARP